MQEVTTMENNGEEKDIHNNEEQPVLSLIQDIKNGRTDSSTLNKEMRLLCVEVFMCDGYSVSQMAHVLKKSEKTIKRDVAEIRDHNSIVLDDDLTLKLAGELMMCSRAHINYLMRLARGKEGSVSERAQAEYYAHNVLSDTITKLQSLGCLHSSPQTIIGEFLHRSASDIGGEIKNLETQLIDMEKITDNPIPTTELKNELQAFKSSVQEPKNGTAADAQERRDKNDETENK
jgi:hypothetical protein